MWYHIKTKLLCSHAVTSYSPPPATSLRVNLRAMLQLTIPPSLHSSSLRLADAISLNEEMPPDMFIPLKDSHGLDPFLLILPADPTAEHLFAWLTLFLFHCDVRFPSEVNRRINPVQPSLFVDLWYLVAAYESAAFARHEVFCSSHAAIWDRVVLSFAKGKLAEAWVGLGGRVVWWGRFLGGGHRVQGRPSSFYLCHLYHCRGRCSMVRVERIQPLFGVAIEFGRQRAGKDEAVL
jgi:hypothetical protein